MTMVDPKLMAFVLEVEAAFTAAFDKHSEAIKDHFPVGFSITTVDGVAARFYEEGIEMYPAEPSIQR